MSKSNTALRRSFSFKHTIEAHVSLSFSKVLPPVKYFDAHALSRAAKVKIDVGSVKSHSCARTVRAVIEHGIVTGLEMEPCGEMRRATPEEAALVKAALKGAGRKNRAQWKPIPIATFLSQAQEYLREGPSCIHICLLTYCVECCEVDWGSDSPFGPFLCIGQIERTR